MVHEDRYCRDRYFPRPGRFSSRVFVPGSGGYPGTPAPALQPPAPAVQETVPATTVSAPGTPAVIPAPGVGIHKIRHVIIIMQENRAFDEYFGTYPGADGIPMNDGVPTVCVPDPASGQCVRPYHDPNDINTGGPHGEYDSIADIDNGKMDGFLRQQYEGIKLACNQTANYTACMAENGNRGCDGIPRPARAPELLGLCR